MWYLTGAAPVPACNINQKGQVVRFIGGMCLFFLGFILFMVALPGNGVWWRLVQGAMMLVGIFVLTEGALGWCALRALGFKTRI